MRLIDADSLIVNMDKGMQGTAREYLKYYQMAVNDEPTAYDVDKAIEQLKEKSEDDSCGGVGGLWIGDAVKILESQLRR